jgi:hypothetical protein
LPARGLSLAFAESGPSGGRGCEQLRQVRISRATASEIVKAGYGLNRRSEVSTMQVVFIVLLLIAALLLFTIPARPRRVRSKRWSEPGQEKTGNEDR